MSDRDTFDQLVLNSAYPMLIVTATAGRRAGCLVGFATQASIQPKRLLVLISKANLTFRVAREAEHLAVHFLGTADHPLATLFGEETGDEVDKFDRCDWMTGPEGTTVLPTTAGWAVGRIRERFDCGDHMGHLLDVVTAHASGPYCPLTSLDVTEMEPGHPA